MSSQWKKSKNRQTGAAIIVIIVAMTIVAIMGTAMLSLFTSSTISELFINNRTKAYYLAQAGRNYATLIQNNLPAGDKVAIDAALNGKTFTLSDGNKFHLSSVTDDSRSYMESTGIVNEGTALETKQKIIFTVESKRFALDVFGVTSIALSSDAIIDSYNSSKGVYSFATHTTDAIVQTNGTSTGSINVSKGTIFGKAVCGQGGNPATAIFVSSFGLITGTRTAAATTQSYAEVLPPGSCTSFYTCGTLLGNPIYSNKYKKTYYKMTASGTAEDPNVLTSGTYRTNWLDLNNKTLTINGIVTLIITEVFTGPDNTGDVLTDTGNVNTINASNIIISPTGSMDLYVLRVATFGQDCKINPPCRNISPCPSNPTPATALRFLGITTTNLNFNSQETYGGASAPGATCSFTSSSNFFGAVSCNTITMTGGGIHVDKAFSATGGGTGVGNVVY